jgi:hypothetical protein
MLEAARSAVRVDDDGDHVEADRARARSRAAAVGQPSRRQPAQAPALTGAEPEQRILIGTDRAPIACATRLDLHEHERRAVSCDQVNLAVAGAHVVSEHGVAAVLKPSSGQDLASRAQRASAIFAHRRDATTRL